MKRFVAGARCPTCLAMDSLRVWEEQSTHHMDCIQCDHQQIITNPQTADDANQSKLIGIKTISTTPLSKPKKRSE